MHVFFACAAELRRPEAKCSLASQARQDLHVRHPRPLCLQIFTNVLGLRSLEEQKRLEETAQHHGQEHEAAQTSCREESSAI